MIIIAVAVGGEIRHFCMMATGILVGVGAWAIKCNRSIEAKEMEEEEKQIRSANESPEMKAQCRRIAKKCVNKRYARQKKPKPRKLNEI